MAVSPPHLLPTPTCQQSPYTLPSLQSPASRRQKERDVIESAMFDMEDVLNVGSEDLNLELKKVRER